MTTNLPIIYGEGKGGGGSTPTNDPTTLVAKQALYILFVVSEGEITSLEDIYLNDTSISNYAASFAFTRGLVAQGRIPGFNHTSVAEGFNLPIVKYNVDTTLSEGIVRSVLGSFEYVDITIQLQSLFFIDAQGNNLSSTVAFEVHTSPSAISPVFSLVATPTITGKATQPYPFNVRVGRPAPNTGVYDWAIRVVRVSEDADQYYNSASQLTVLTYYSSDNVSNYPGSALIAIRLEDASQVGNSIPNFSFRGKGIKLYLPDSTYYQADTGLYRNISDTAWVAPTDPTRATWNGAFHQVAGNYTPQYSNNLSWVLYNLLSDWLSFIVDGIRYPRGFDIPKEYLAKYSFEAFARYCDEKLAYRDPLTNIVTIEPRYTLNRQFIDRKDAKIARNEILSAGNADLIETGGLVTVVWDRKFTQAEIDSSPLFTNQNVDEGLFEYSSSDIAENYTQVNITIQEIDNRNRTRTLTVFAAELETFLSLPSGYFNNLYSYQSVDFLVLGCASVAAGIRKGRTILWDVLMTDLAGDGIVQFKNLSEAALLNRGSLIRIHDSAMYNTIETGRIVSYISTVANVAVTLDRTITCSGVTNLLVYKDDGTLVDLILDEISGQHSVVHSSSFGNLTLLTQSVFVQKTARTTLYKVTNVSFDDDKYSVEAVKYDSRKYDFVDAEVILPTGNGYVDIITGKASAVYDLQITNKPFIDVTRKQYTLTWKHDALPDRIYTYYVEWSISTGQQGAEMVYSKNYDFNQTVTVPGSTYSFTVTVFSSLDLSSVPTNLTFTERVWDDGVTTWDSGTHWAF